MVSRLADQKGFDLVREVGDAIVELGVSLVVLGTGQQEYHEFLAELAARHPGRVAAHLTFDNELAHWIEAGADMFLMPSRYEPCGLNQLYSLRYGTVPVVRATGGLVDTVVDHNPESGTGTGFTFVEYDAKRCSRQSGAPSPRSGTRTRGAASCAAAWSRTSGGRRPPRSTWVSTVGPRRRPRSRPRPRRRARGLTQRKAAAILPTE
jgi:hypothetical protein